jgi:hypothetical protein
MFKTRRKKSSSNSSSNSSSDSSKRKKINVRTINISRKKKISSDSSSDSSNKSKKKVIQSIQFSSMFTLPSQIPSLKKLTLSDTLLQNTELRYGDSAYNILKEYAKNGETINAHMRIKQINTTDKTIINRLNDILTPASIVFNNSSADYFIVKRKQSEPYINEGENRGFLSTANKFVQGFGNYFYKFIVPMDCKIAVIKMDVKYENIYEIILPPDTQINMLDEDIGLVMTRDSQNKLKMFKNLVEQKQISFNFSKKRSKKRSIKRSIKRYKKRYKKRSKKRSK